MGVDVAVWRGRKVEVDGLMVGGGGWELEGWRGWRGIGGAGLAGDGWGCGGGGEG